MVSVTPSGAAPGAELSGVDLSSELDEHSFEEIRKALHAHEVIFFRNQQLTPEQHIAFSRRFGALEHHVRQDRWRPGYPEIFVVSNVIENGKPIGSQDAGYFWHSDLCYAEKPSLGSLLTTKIVGMDAAESDAVLAELFSQLKQDELVYRHRWQVGDLLFWDNCATQHRAIGDYELPQRRLMERTTVCGTVPYE